MVPQPALRAVNGDGNGFGRGLAPAWDNKDKWQYAKPLLTLPRLTPDCTQIRQASAAYRDLLTISRTADAFSMQTAEQVQRELSFPLSGTDGQTPGVVLMKAGDLVVVFNATPDRQQLAVPSLTGGDYTLHPVQAAGSDDVVKSARYTAETGAFAVPGHTVAVFTTR